MIEASIGVLIWLSVALLVGVIVGWYVNSAMQQKESMVELDILQKHYEEKESQVKKLKDDYLSQKRNLDRLTDESIVCRHQLLQKSNFLTKTSDELFRLKNKLREVRYIEKERNLLKHKVAELNIQLKEKEHELKEFEKILLRADTLMGESSTDKEQERHERHIISTLESEVLRLKNLIDRKDQTITQLNKKLMNAYEKSENIKEDHIVISKDQLSEIEKQMANYTERIKKLEEENIKLSQSYILQPKDQPLSAIIKFYESIQGWKESIKAKFFHISHKKTTNI